MEETTETTQPTEKKLQMPRKGRDNPTLSEKVNLEKALREQCSSVRSFAVEQDTTIAVLTSWVAYHGLTLPSKDEMAVTKFYKNVELNEETECWLWKGKDSISFQGRVMKPERFAVSIVAGRGDLGKKRLIHTCGNDKCVNPDHLVLKSELEPVLASDVDQGSEVPAPETVVVDTPEAAPEVVVAAE